MDDQQQGPGPPARVRRTSPVLIGGGLGFFLLGAIGLAIDSAGSAVMLVAGIVMVAYGFVPRLRPPGGRPPGS